MPAAVHALAQKGLIRGGRGNIVILDRNGLVERAGPYYGLPENEYERLLPNANARTLHAV